MSDVRDINHDGKVSLLEKVKDKLHIGHRDHHTGTTTLHPTTSTHPSSYSTALPISGYHSTLNTAAGPTVSGAYDPRDLNRDGHVSTKEKLETVSLARTSDSRDLNVTDHVSTEEKLATGTGSHDSRDLNHDRHVSVGERLTTGSSDPRDLNRDGHVSTAEKLATDSHGTSAYDPRDLSRDGHVSTGEKLTTDASSSLNAGTSDPRHLNRDGHVSTGEKLATGFNGGTGAHDLQDLNRDEYVSTAERLAAGYDHMNEAHMTLHEEQLAISKREVGAGEVDICKRVVEEHVQQTVPVRHEEVIIERRPLSGVADPNAHIASHDETLRVVLSREEVVAEKFVVPTEEVIVRKQEVVDQQTVGATLRAEYVETVQTGTHGSVHDARDTNHDGHVSMSEKLKGATSDTSGVDSSTTGIYDARDTNRDGHVSMGEKLKGVVTGTAPHAARG